MGCIVYMFGWMEPWMKEAMDNTSRVGVCLRCPVFISVHFSLRDEGSSEYIRLCEGRVSLSPNFQTFHDPRHQFHGISTLVSETLHPLATLALLHMIPWTFLHFLKGVWHEIFDFRFFSKISVPRASEYLIGIISNFFENSRRYSRMNVCQRCQRHRQKMKKR